MGTTEQAFDRQIRLTELLTVIMIILTFAYQSAVSPGSLLEQFIGSLGRMSDSLRA